MPAAATAAGSPDAVSPDREIVQERVFDAPRALVWAAWTDAKHLDRWWGPNGFRNETFEMDFRVGGSWRYMMHGPDGKDWPNLILYKEITPLERIVYDHGETTDDPHCFHVIVTFEDDGARTRVTMRSQFPTAEACAEVKKFGVVEGGRQTLARLSGFLTPLKDGSAEGAMVISRLFNAPRAQVFEAWTKPEVIAKWWGPKGCTLPVCELDFRPGGAYRMAMRGPNGEQYPFHGTFREIVPNERIVFDSIIDHLGGVETIATVTFEDDGDKTLLTVRQTVPADAAAAKGQVQGWSETLEKLGAVVDAA